MKIYNNLAEVSLTTLTKIKQGKTHHWKRTYAMELKGKEGAIKIGVMSQNIFQRILDGLKHILCCMQEKNIRKISIDEA